MSTIKIDEIETPRKLEEYDNYNSRIAIMPYIGGKLNMAQYIVPHIPRAYGYAEPFCGMASIGMRLKPHKQEFYNDIDDRVTAFFNCLRDRKMFNHLQEALILSVCSQKNFLGAMRPVISAPDATAEELYWDEIEKCRRFVILKIESFGATETGWAGVSDFRKRDKVSDRHWGKLLYLKRYFKSWADVALRLKHARFYNMDAISLIQRVNFYNVTVYCDPPYPHYVTVDKKYYIDDNHNEYHNKLATALNDFEGNVVISSFSSPEYDELYKGWEKIELKTRPINIDLDSDRENTEVLYRKIGGIKGNKIQKSAWLQSM